MANNNVSFDLELAVKQFNTNLKNVGNNLSNFHNDFRKKAKDSSTSWGSFVGNLGAAGVTAAISGLQSLVSGMASFTTEAVRAAVDAQETASKFEAVFSTISDSSDAMAKDLQKNFGLGVTESKNLLSATGDLLTGFGFAQEEALALSGDVQKLSVDLASFTNFSGGAKGASEAITKALLGERESVKALGVTIQEKAVQDQIALNNAKGLTFETEQQAKAQATLDLIIKQSGNAIGDYARTNQGAANQLRLFEKKVEDLTIAFGENFLPVLQPVLKMVNEFIDSLDQEMISNFVTNGMVALIEGFSYLVEAINPAVTAIKNIGSVFNIIQNGITSGLAVIGGALTSAAQGWILIFREMLAALPARLVPDGWIAGLDEASAAIDETIKTMADQIMTDSNDMAESMNSIMNPENVLSEENIQNILGRVNVVKEGVLASRDAIDSDEMKRAKLKAANQKKQDALDKKRQDKLNQEKLKQNEFEQTLFGKQLSWEEAGGKQRADNLKSTFALMATHSKSGNKELAAIGKAAAIATATIDGIAAVQKALASAPPPVNFALAGVVGAATAINIADMAGVKFERGGVVPGSSFTGDQVLAGVNSGEMILNRGQQAELFQQLNNGGSGDNSGLMSAINALGDRISQMEIILIADDNEIARSASRGVEAGIVIGRS